jgi:hypothetical protein
VLTKLNASAAVRECLAGWRRRVEVRAVGGTGGGVDADVVGPFALAGAGVRFDASAASLACNASFRSGSPLAVGPCGGVVSMVMVPSNAVEVGSE